MGRPAPTPVQTSNALRKWMLKHADDPMLMDGHWLLDHMTGDDEGRIVFLDYGGHDDLI